MDKKCHKNKVSKGFSLIELLIVIAVMVILVGVVAPSLFRHFERARRALDAANAKQISIALMNACVLGDIEFTSSEPDKGDGVWIMMCKDGRETAPEPYHNRNFKEGRKSVWCGVSKGIKVNGAASTDDWIYNTQLEKVLQEAGISVENLRTHSNNDSTGWDWIIVEVGYDKEKKLVSRIYSGKRDQNGSIVREGTSNIEKWIYGE